MKKLNIMKKNRGFTLIEIMVVIIIIGVLASIILVSLSSSNKKAQDSNIKSYIKNLHSQANVQYELLNGCYGNKEKISSCTASIPAAVNAGLCSSANVNSIFQNSLIKSLIDKTVAMGSKNACVASAGGTAYAVVIQYKSDLSKGWCVDSAGASKEVAISADSQAGLNAALTGFECLKKI